MVSRPPCRRLTASFNRAIANPTGKPIVPSTTCRINRWYRFSAIPFPSHPLRFPPSRLRKPTTFRASESPNPSTPLWVTSIKPATCRERAPSQTPSDSTPKCRLATSTFQVIDSTGAQTRQSSQFFANCHGVQGAASVCEGIEPGRCTRRSAQSLVAQTHNHKISRLQFFANRHQGKT
jgi:hypothetical protein